MSHPINDIDADNLPLAVFRNNRPRNNTINKFGEIKEQFTDEEEKKYAYKDANSPMQMGN